MQRGLGIFAIFAVLVAGARFTTSPSPPKTSETPALARAQHVPGRALTVDTTCPEFSEGTKGQSPGEIAALIDRYRDIVPGQAPAQWYLPEHTHILLMTVPDPLHTHLNLQFDRTMDALQEAAQDEDYTYNSSWLPWMAQMPEFSGLNDQETEEKAMRERELCPGVILFRQRDARRMDVLEGIPPEKTIPPDETYDSGLLVFVVAEKPTTGLNRIQWDNALGWMRDHVDSRADHTLRILGPTFSGSTPSVVRALQDLEKQQKFFSSVLLYTGTMRGCTSYRFLQEEMSHLQPVQVRPADFEQNDAIQIDHYFEFLKERGHQPSEVAILSEDETAYGGQPNSAAKPTAHRSPCAPDYGKEGPLYLYYPRDISAVRSAYQEQSIFAPPTGSTGTAHIVLAPQASESTHVDTDTIPTFSGANSALEQEAGLYGVIDSLKAHGTRFVILRATSTLDYLFLTRFLHRAYPETFIVTVGPDILYGRDVDTTEFRGVAALSVFPLLPRGQDWTSGTDRNESKDSTSNPSFRHAHRIFGADSMEGTYLASRYLITDPGITDPGVSPKAHPFGYKQGLPDYGYPFWDPEQQKERETRTRQPDIWLSVVGRNGYWPVAVLEKPYSTSSAPGPEIVSNLQPVDGPPPPDSPVTGVPDWMTFSLPPAWKVACGLMFFGVLMHLLASRFLCNRQSFSMFVQFAPLRGVRQLLLLALGWGIICSMVILMYNCTVPLKPDLQGHNVWCIYLLGVSVGLGLLGILYDMGKRSMQQMQSSSAKSPGLIMWIPLLLFAISLVASRAIFTDMPTAFRAVNVTSGVSPVISLLLVLCGLYWWFWQELSGLALLGPGRPTLPCKQEMKMLARISSQMAGQIKRYAMPLPLPGREPWRWSAFYGIPLVIVAFLFIALLRPPDGNFDSMLHSFENRSFNLTLHFLFAAAVYLLMLESAQLLGTWLGLKRLLLALNRTPLRRTFAALQGLSMHSLWSMSGTTSRSRYTIFSHQLESLVHLKNVLNSPDGRGVGNLDLRDIIDNACQCALNFITKRASKADLAIYNTRRSMRTRHLMSQCAESIFNVLLIDDWCKETGTLDLVEREKKDEDKEVLPLSEKKVIRQAEEFICLIYVGYLQNMLARMRTMVLAILGLYAALAFSLAFYPYTPRPTIALSLLLLLGAVGSVVAVVYAGLDRDTTLSHITNTKPNTLGLEFWLRLGSFIGIPIIGLLVAQFPEIGDFIASWIQPSLSAVK
jgi:hypothetical protein